MTLLAAALAFAVDPLEQAIDARREGNYAAAAAYLDVVRPLVDPADDARWNLERGLAEELQWRPERAEPFYRAAILAGGPAAAEARYHLVVVLDDLGRVAEARRELDTLLATPGLNQAFLPVLRLERGVLDLHAGQVRRGERRVRADLDELAATGGHAWAEGRARTALIETWLRTAADLEFEQGEWRQRANLGRRVKLLQEAEAQMYAVFRTEEPEWITGSLLLVGRAYEDLAADLEAAVPPRRLGEGAAEVFRQAVLEKAQAPRTKAFNCYDKGVEVAAQLDWSSPVVQSLREARAVLAEVR